LHERTLRLAQQRAAGVRELNLAMRSVEEANAELALEATDLLTERGLSDVQSRRGATEVQLFGDCNEVA
jgi:hypothetical protein